MRAWSCLPCALGGALARHVADEDEPPGRPALAVDADPLAEDRARPGPADVDLDDRGRAAEQRRRGLDAPREGRRAPRTPARALPGPRRAACPTYAAGSTPKISPARRPIMRQRPSPSKTTRPSSADSRTARNVAWRKPPHSGSSFGIGRQWYPVRTVSERTRRPGSADGSPRPAPADPTRQSGAISFCFRSFAKLSLSMRLLERRLRRRSSRRCT